MKFGGGFGIDYTENTLSKPGLALFSSVGNTATTFSDSHLMKTYFNGATCTNLCPFNPPDNLLITYNTPLENVFIGTVYDIKKLKFKNFDYQSKQLCSQGSIACGSNARETEQILLQTEETTCFIYPNPASSQLTIEWEVAYASVHTIEIRNTSGQILYKEQLQADEGHFTTTLNVQELLPGAYVLLIRNDEKLIQKIFVKQ